MTLATQSHAETDEQRRDRLKAFYSGMTKRVLDSQPKGGWGPDVRTRKRETDQEFDLRAAQTGARAI